MAGILPGMEKSQENCCTAVNIMHLCDRPEQTGWREAETPLDSLPLREAQTSCWTACLSPPAGHLSYIDPGKGFNWFCESLMGDGDQPASLLQSAAMLLLHIDIGTIDDRQHQKFAISGYKEYYLVIPVR